MFKYEFCNQQNWGLSQSSIKRTHGDTHTTSKNIHIYIYPCSFRRWEWTKHDKTSFLFACPGLFYFSMSRIVLPPILLLEDKWRAKRSQPAVGFQAKFTSTNQPTAIAPAPPSIPTSHPHLQARPQTAPGNTSTHWVSLADFFPSNTSRNQALAGYNLYMLDVIINKPHIITYRINTSLFGLLFTRFPLTWETRIEVFHFLGLGEFIGRHG